jgi:F0F1-type ATP synthase delta subunit
MNSKQTINVWSRVLQEMTAGKTAADQKKTVARLEAILKRKKKGYLLPMILKKSGAAAEKQTKLEISLAHDQPAEVTGKLEKALAKGVEGWKKTEVKINASLIGGFVAKTSQYLVDASIKNQLEKLRRSYRQ